MLFFYSAALFPIAKAQVSRPLLCGIDLMRSQRKAIDSKSLCLRLKSEKVPSATRTPKANGIIAAVTIRTQARLSGH